jgi:glycosyltransferase involved in cell wall biosynthesis
MNDLISIITPHYNRSKNLESVYEMLLTQSYVSWEWIIVDDFSEEDPTKEIEKLKSDKIKIIRLSSNLGPAAARNIGIDNAKGRFIVFLDSDDSWDPKKLEKQISFVLEQDEPDNVFCWTQTKIIYKNSEEKVMPLRGMDLGEEAAQYLFISNGFAQTSSILIPRIIAKKLRFEATLRQYEDFLFFMMASSLGMKMLLLAEPLNFWNNDLRDDRLSLSKFKNIDNGERFLCVADSMISRKAVLAFKSKILGSIYIKKNPIHGVFIIISSILYKSISPKYGIGIIIDTIFPKKVFLYLKAKTSYVKYWNKKEF